MARSWRTIHKAMDDKPSTNSSTRPILMVFSDDWGRHPSSCQHLVTQLLPRYEAVWVNTIGMRRPRFDLATLRRGVEKFRHWTRPRSEPQPLPSNLTVLKPLMWPWLSAPRDRTLNQRLLVPQLRRWIQKAGRPVIAVTTLPVVADLMGPLPVERWVYYCVDDFGRWPGLDQRAMESMERDVIERADVLVAAGENLRNRLLRHRDRVELMTHGVNLDHWRPRPAPVVHTALDGCESPRVVFWGLIDRRMDIEWVRQLSERMNRGTIALVGPLADPDPELESIPRVRRIGSVPYEQLPAVAQQADALVMPYADLPVTRAMQPLKLLEYLATGKPVAVRDLPATRAWSDCLDIASGPEEFVATVVERLKFGVPASQSEARRRLDDESWSAKARMFEQYVLGAADFPDEALLAASTPDAR